MPFESPILLSSAGLCLKHCDQSHLRTYWSTPHRKLSLLVAVLITHADFDVVGAAGNGQEAVAPARELAPPRPTLLLSSRSVLPLWYSGESGRADDVRLAFQFDISITLDCPLRRPARVPRARIRRDAR